MTTIFSMLYGILYYAVGALVLFFVIKEAVKRGINESNIGKRNRDYDL